MVRHFFCNRGQAMFGYATLGMHHHCVLPPPPPRGGIIPCFVLWYRVPKPVAIWCHSTQYELRDVVAGLPTLFCPAPSVAPAAPALPHSQNFPLTIWPLVYCLELLLGSD